MTELTKAVVFIEPPQFDMLVDENVFTKRGFEKILVVDEELFRLKRLDSRQLAQFERVLPAKLGDQKALQALSKDLQQSYEVAAVLGCSESSVLPAAYISEFLGVRGIGPRVAHLCRNKLQMIQALSKAGVCCPNFRLALPGSDSAELATSLGGYPLVCKPLMGFSSFGVVRVDSNEQLNIALHRIRRRNRFIMGRYYALEESAPEDQVLVQSFATGIEVAVDGYVRNTATKVLAVIDKPDVSQGPYFDDRSHVLPARITPVMARAIDNTVQECVAALGLDNSPFHIEMRIDGERITVIEIGARIGLATSLRNATGIDLLAVTLALKLGEEPPDQPKWQRYAGSLCLSPDKEGRFIELANKDQVLRDPRIVSVRQFVSTGQRLNPPPDSTGYVGIISAMAGSYDDVYDAMHLARKRLRLVLS